MRLFLLLSLLLINAPHQIAPSHLDESRIDLLVVNEELTLIVDLDAFYQLLADQLHHVVVEGVQSRVELLYVVQVHLHPDSVLLKRILPFRSQGSPARVNDIVNGLRDGLPVLKEVIVVRVVHQLLGRGEFLDERGLFIAF